MNYYEIKKRTAKALLLLPAVLIIIFGSLNVSAAYKAKDYSRVYKYSYFKTHNKDLPESILSSPSKSLKYFVEKGMAEGRRGKISFNVKTYKANYADLRKLYGNNLKKYYMHYQEKGYKTRFARYPLSHYKFSLVVDSNGGSDKNGKTYKVMTRKYGTTVKLPSAKKSGYTFKSWKLTEGQGTLKGESFKYTMNRKGPTSVVRAQWKKKKTTSSTTTSSSKSIPGAVAMADFAHTQLGKGGTTYWNYFNDVFNGKASNYEWCCMFATYCAYKAGLISKTASYGTIGNGHYPRTASQRELASRLKAKGQLKLRSSGYIPKKGDMIFFTSASDKSNTENYSHVGIVYGVKDGKVITVEGNTGTYNRYTSYVKEKSYDLTADRVAAYGIIK